MEKEVKSSETIEDMEAKSNSEIDADKQGMSSSAYNITKLSLSAVKNENNDTNPNDKVKLENTTNSSIKSSELSELSSSSLSSSFSPHQNITMLKKVSLNSDNCHRPHSYEAQSCKSEKELLESLKNSSSTSKEHKSHGIRNVYYYSPPAKKLVVREHGPFTARPHYYSNNHHNNHHHEHNELQKQLQCSSEVNSLPSSASNSERNSLQKEYNGVGTSHENVNNITHNSNNNSVVQKSAMTTARSCCSSSISSISEPILPIGCHCKEFNTESIKRENYILIKERTNFIGSDKGRKQELSEKELELEEEVVEKWKIDHHKSEKSENNLEKLSKLDIAEMERIKSNFLVDSQVMTTEPAITPSWKECTKLEQQQLQEGKTKDQKSSLEHNAITHKASFIAKSPSAKMERISSLHESFSSVSISPLSRKDSSLSASQTAERAQRKSLIIGVDKNVNDSICSKNDSNTKTKQNIYTINNNNSSKSKLVSEVNKSQCEANQITGTIANQKVETTEKSNRLSDSSEANIAHCNSNNYYHNNNILKERNNHHDDSGMKQDKGAEQHINVEEKRNPEVQHFTSQLLCSKTSSSLGEQNKEHKLSDISKVRELESEREEWNETEHKKAIMQRNKKDDNESHSSPLPRFPISFSSAILKSNSNAQHNSDPYDRNVTKFVIHTNTIANNNSNSTSKTNYNNTVNGTSEDKLINAKLDNENINMKNNDMENLNDINNNNNNNNNLISSELTESYESLSPTLLRSSNFLSISSMTNTNNANTTNINKNYNYNSHNLQHSSPLDHSGSSNSCCGDNKYDDNQNNNSCTNTNSIKDSLRQMTSTSFTPNTTLVISPISEVSDYFATYERNLSELLQHNSLASKWKLKEESHDSNTTNNYYSNKNNSYDEAIGSVDNTQTEKEIERNSKEEMINSNESNNYKDYNYTNYTVNKVEHDTKCYNVSEKAISKITHNHSSYEDEDDTDDDFHYSVSQPSPSLSPSLNVSFTSEHHKNLHYLAPFRTSPENNNNTILTNTNNNYITTVGKCINANEDGNQYISANTNYNSNNNTILNHNMLSMAREMDVENCYAPVSATVSVSTLADHASSPILYSAPLLTRPTINENWTSHTNDETSNIYSTNNYHKESNINNNSNSFSVSSSISSTTTPLASTNASMTLVNVDTTSNANMNMNINMNMNNNINEYNVQHDGIDEKEHNELSHTLAERPEHWPAPPIPVMRRPPIVPLNENDLNSESHTILTPFLLYSNHKDKHYTHNTDNEQQVEKNEEIEEIYDANNVQEISGMHKHEEESKEEEIYDESVQMEQVHENNLDNSTTRTIETKINTERCDDKENEANNEGDNVIDGLKEETKKSAREIEKDVAKINSRDDKEQIQEQTTEENTSLYKENEIKYDQCIIESENVTNVNEDPITQSIHNKEADSIKKTSLPNDLRAQLQELERFEAENEAALTHYSKLSHRRRHNRIVTHQLFWSHSSKLQASQAEVDKPEEENTDNNTASQETIKEKQSEEVENDNTNSYLISKESSVKQEDVSSVQSMQKELSENKEKEERKTEMADLVNQEKQEEIQTNQENEEEKEEKNSEVEKEMLQSESLTNSSIVDNDDNKSKIRNDELEKDKRSKEEEKITDNETENVEIGKTARLDDKEDKLVKEIVSKTKNCPVEDQERPTEIITQPDKDVATRTSAEENKTGTQAMSILLHTSYASSRFKFRQVERDQQRARVEAIEQFCHFAAKERKSNINSNNINNNNNNNNDKIVKEEHTSATSTNPLNMIVTSSTSLPSTSSFLLTQISLQQNKEQNEQKEHQHEQEEKYNNGKESVFTRLSRSKSPYFNKAVHQRHKNDKKVNVENDRNTTYTNSKNKRNHFLLNNISETHTEAHEMQKANTLGEHDKSKWLTLKSNNKNNTNTSNKETTLHNYTHTKLTKQDEEESGNECRLEKFRSIKSACSLNSLNANHHKYNITFLDDLNSSDNNNSTEKPLPLSSVETRRRPISKSKCRAISSPPERSRVNRNCKEIFNKFEISEADGEVHKICKRSVVTFTLPTYSKQEELELEQEEESKEEMKNVKDDRKKCKEDTHEYKKRRRNNTKNTNHMENSSNSSSSVLSFVNSSNNRSNSMYKGVNKTEREMNINAKYERAATSTFTHPLRSSSPSSRTSMLLPEKFKSSLSSSSPKLTTSLSHELGKIEKDSKVNELHTRIHIPSQRVRKVEENVKNQKDVKENEMEKNKNNTNVDVVKVNKCNYNKENVHQKFARFTRTHSPAKGKATIVVTHNVTYNSNENNKIGRESDHLDNESRERGQQEGEKDVHGKQKLLHKHSMVNGKEIPL